MRFPWKKPASFIIKLSAVAAVVILAITPPLLLLILSFSHSWRWPALLPLQWTLRAWTYLFSPAAGSLSALITSLAIALAVTLLAILIAIPAARALAVYNFSGKKPLLFLLMLPVFVNPLTSVMGMHMLFLRYGLADTIAGVILTHLIPTVPYTTLMLASSFANFDLDYEVQAKTLGASTYEIWRYITLPAIAPAIAVAAAFAFLISWSQYLTTLIIGGGRIVTLTLQLVAFQRSGDEAITSAITLVFILPALITFISVANFLKQTKLKDNCGL